MFQKRLCARKKLGVEFPSDADYHSYLGDPRVVNPPAPEAPPKSTLASVALFTNIKIPSNRQALLNMRIFPSF